MNHHHNYKLTPTPSCLSAVCFQPAEVHMVDVKPPSNLARPAVSGADSINMVPATPVNLVITWSVMGISLL